MLTQETIKDLLKELFQKRNYISEGDLRVNFVIALDKICHPAYVIANFPIKYEDKTVYEDLRIIDSEGKIYLIQFKYCPSKVPIPFGGFEVETRKRTPKKKRVARFNEDCEQLQQVLNRAEGVDCIEAAYCIFITNQKNLTKNTPFPFEDLSADFKFCVQEIRKGEPAGEMAAEVSAPAEAADAVVEAAE